MTTTTDTDVPAPGADEINRSVAAGARYLDERRPTWHTEIDLDILQLSNANRCVLGQLAKSISGGEIDNENSISMCGFYVLAPLCDSEHRRRSVYFEDGCAYAPDLAAIAIDSPQDAIRLGFNLPDGIADLDVAWARLNEAWKAEILARRGLS